MHHVTLDPQAEKFLNRSHDGDPGGKAGHVVSAVKNSWMLRTRRKISSSFQCLDDCDYGSSCGCEERVGRVSRGDRDRWLRRISRVWTECFVLEVLKLLRVLRMVLDLFHLLMSSLDPVIDGSLRQSSLSPVEWVLICWRVLRSVS